MFTWYKTQLAIALVCTVFLIAATGCGGSSSDQTNNTVVPIVSATNTGVFEGNIGTTPLSFTVSLNTAVNNDITIDYAITDDTATVGIDYLASNNGTVTIPAGDISTTVIANVLADTDVEPDENLVLTLSNPTGAILGTAVARGAITNDDGPFGYTARPSNTTCLAGDRPTTANPNITLDRAFPNLTFIAPLGLHQVPNNNAQWYVVERNGYIRSFTNNAATATSDLFLDISAKVDTVGEGGLLGMAFHPSYPNPGYVYLYYTTSDSGSNFRTIVSRFTLNGTVLDPVSELILLTIPQPYSNHNGGHVAFGQDGYLYIGMGDGGNGGDPQDNSQNTQNLLGAMLRIDISTTPYSIPTDNPFQGNQRCSNGIGMANCPEIYAWGLRNPWRWSFDKQTGDLWLGDVGQNVWEEIDQIELGKNYGWRCYEGNHTYNTTGCGAISNYTFPVYEYDRSQGNSITGGYVYRGTAIPNLIGTYVYGDWGNGTIWGLSDPYGVNSVAQQLTSTSGLVSFAEDVTTGELYVLNMYNGGIYRLIDSNSGPVTTMEPLLSQTGCALPADPKQVPSGMIAYNLNSPLWSDNADKKRWFALPDGAQITILPYGNWEFPIGSVLRKDFYLNNKIIETRLLMRHTDGGWAGYSYEWNGAETEATLLADVKTKPITGTNQSWTYPSPSQCLQCHISSATFTLGPETAQLNRDYDYADGTTANQVTTFEHIGLFTTALPATAFKIADPDDNVTYSLDERARSYLHTNCSNCHRQGGTGRGSADFRYNLSFGDMNVCNQMPVAGTLGIPGARLLVPGIPTQSLVSVRMHNLDSTRMPVIGSYIVHSEGTQLIDDWILSIINCP